MKELNFYWQHVEYKDICVLYTGIDLIINSDYSIQLDTGCPFTFIYEEFLLKLGYNLDLGLLEYNENDFGDKFYYINNFKLDIDGYIFEIKKCYIEFKKSIPENKFISDLNKINIGFLGNDFFENKCIAIDYSKNKISLFESIEDLVCVYKAKKFFKFKFIKSGYIVLPVFINKPRHSLFDTANYSDIVLKKSEFDLVDSKFLYTLSLSRPDFNFESINKNHIFKIEIGKYCVEKEFIINKLEKDFENYIFNNDEYDTLIGNGVFLNHILILNFQEFNFAIL